MPAGYINPLVNIIRFGFDPVNNPLRLTETINKLTLPINCVMIGHQKPISKLMEATSMGPLRGIFNE